MLIRSFVRFSPWWLIAAISFSVTPSLGWMVIDSVTAREQLQLARDTAAPVPVPLHRLSRSGFVNLIDEVAISGQLGGTLYPTATGEGQDIVLTLVPSEGDLVAKLAFFVDENDVLDTLGALATMTDQNGRTILRGVMSRSATARSRVVQALDRGLPAFTGELIIVEPFYGRRNAVLAREIEKHNIIIGFGVFLIVMINGLVVWKFRAAWRRGAKKAQKPPVKLQETKMPDPWEPSKRAPGPVEKDPFCDGPITTIGRKM
ncbi:hypothetical protein DS901_12945 [Loktanella sp. D2R18]|uniref:hypothetical protein n=1 Tax=Rhodobacterales TaxID=204455 RepID=UPI000DE8442C|nr:MULTISPECIES: hypothetical protein [Rhodobacterales]MDO6592177.1 hypothetical protein [Yoonia sp. 1_MG-2023]RBW42595.1 hypothetical protein DS901_12945 [Loktanella sp. D2R18]